MTQKDFSASNSSVVLYDTTLRDGTQGEGISFSVAAKLRVVEKLDQFGIDYIEGGWPGSNPRDMAFFEAAHQLKFKQAKLTAFGSTRKANVAAEKDAQLQLLLQAHTPVVTLFGKSWLLHVTEVLRTTPEENLSMIEDSVRFLVEQGKEVVYDAEHFFDGYMDNPQYALQTLEAAARGGADWLTLCDTNGGMMIDDLHDITIDVIEHFPQTKVGIHCHNDSGLGVACSLVGIQAGAAMVQATINGYGERTGNANLTTIIPNLSLKMGYKLNCEDQLNKLRDLSLFTAEMANLSLDIKAPYVGESAFAHKGGVHANAASKASRSYEHIVPEKVGNRQRVLISDMSGRSSLIMKAKEMGFHLEEKSEALKPFLEELKHLEFQGYAFEAADASFELLLKRWHGKPKVFFDLITYRVMVECKKATGELISEATVKLKIDDITYHEVAEASGPVSALDHALRKALQKIYPEIQSVQLRDFKVRILDNGGGTDARIRVQIDSTDGKNIWGTVGASDNLIAASWEALRDSVEYKLYQSQKLIKRNF